MSAFYEASRALFKALTSAPVQLALAVDDGRIDALKRLIAELDAKHQAIEAAVTELQNEGQTNEDLSRALLEATFDYSATQQLLVLAIDGREQIVVAATELDGLTEQLKAVATSTQELVDNVGKVASVLDAVGKVTKLAQA